MRTIAVLPIKSFDAAKQRLSEALRGGSRHLLAQAMFSDVLAALRRMRRLEAIAVVTDDHEVEATLRGDPVTVLRDRPRAGQSAATRIGIDHAVAEGFDRALLVPGDTPLIDHAAVDQLLESARAERLGVVIVPDRHRTGTNALLISPPDALKPRFGEGSLDRHLEAVRSAGLSHRLAEVDSLMHDVDTPEDLAALAAALEGSRGVAPRTRGALRQFDRLRIGGPAGAGADGAAAPGAAAPGATGRGASGPEPAGTSQPTREAAAWDRPGPDARTWRPRREGAAADQRPAWA